MPFKSKAQMRKIYQLEKEGKIKPGTADEFKSKTKNINKLPEKVKKKK